MQSKILLNKDGDTKVKEIKVHIHGSGGELGMQNVEKLAELIKELKTFNEQDEILQHFYFICGYCQCCANSGFLDKESAKGVLELAGYLTANEVKRVEQQKGKTEK